MKLIPVITEKTTFEAKNGKYTFLVPFSMTKLELKKVLKESFSVHATSVWMQTLHERIKRGIRGNLKKRPLRKKAIVVLKDKEKLDFFETKKEGKKK